MEEGHVCAQLLGQGTGHKTVAQVDDELGYCHFHKGGPGLYDSQRCKLSRAGQVCKGHDNGLEGGEAGSPCHDSKCKGHGQVSQTDGYAVF